MNKAKHILLAWLMASSQFPLPSHLRVGVREVSVDLAHERFVPHPCTPPLRWEGSGCAQMERHIRN